MTSYKQKLQDSENRAHDKNTATKISKELTDLQSTAEESPLTPRRWVWELIQNAKDVHHDQGVNIQIDFNPHGKEPALVFRHNGKPFTAEDIRFLIEQTSSKDRKIGENGRRDVTGKFGTGFLATHLLSEIVDIEAVAKEPELDYRKFKLRLDRRNYNDIDYIMDAVRIALQSVANLDTLPILENYEKNDLNTSFTYHLIDPLSINTAHKGIADLIKTIPYALAFVADIESVELTQTGDVYLNEKPENLDPDNIIETITIKHVDFTGSVEEYKIAKLSKGHTSIAIRIEEKDDCIYVRPFEEGIPKLFCDFPLIGTEVFEFPAIINNPNFTPTDPRDGVYLTQNTKGLQHIEENKAIIKEAIQLYYQLLNFASKAKWKDIHLLAKVKSVSEQVKWLYKDWYNQFVLEPIIEKLLYLPIVKNAQHELKSILTQEDGHYMWFPSSPKKEIRQQLWEIGNYWFPHCLPEQFEIDLWYNLIWKECGRLTLEQLAKFIKNHQTLSQLQEVLTGIEATAWLNLFYELLNLDESEQYSILDKYPIVPDQNGELTKKALLSEEVGDIPETFKDILSLFGNDIRSELKHPEVEMDLDERAIDLAHVVMLINKEVEEKTNDRATSKNYREAFNKLLIYFKNSPETARTLFPRLYTSKHILYDDEQILENIDKAEQLTNLLAEFNLESPDAIRDILIARQGPSTSFPILPVTQEILASMGISSPEEWAIALEDKDIKMIFDHESVPTTDMYLWAQSHIKNAKRSVVDHLESLDDYDCTFMENETADTVLSGIMKNGREIYVVFRPAYKGEVIIYSQSERSTLLEVGAELWVDDGENVFEVTLGQLIHATEIKKFPIL